MPQKLTVIGVAAVALLVALGGLAGAAVGSTGLGPAQSNTGNDQVDKHAISFVAFCSGTTAPSAGDVDIVVTANKTGNPDEPIALNWGSTSEVDYVVSKASTSMQNHATDPSGFFGTVISGEGTPANSDQTASSPCKTGDSGVKFNFDESQSKFVPE